MGTNRTKKRREGRRRKSQQDQWKNYATAPDMLRFNSCTGRLALRQQPGFRPLGPAIQPKQAGKKQPFGHPSPCDSRFAKPTLIIQTATVTPALRSLGDVLMDYPKKRFEGISQDILDLAAKSVLQVTDEVTVKWLHKWCPYMDFALIFDWIRSIDCVENNYKHNLYMVPSEAMDIKGTGTTLANLYRNCRVAYSKYPVLKMSNVVEIFDNCIIVCRVLKNEKCTDLLKRTKEIIQWLPVGLGCKELEVQRKLSRNLNNLSPSLKDRNKLEEELLDAALVEFEIHRQEFTIKLLQQVKLLLDSSDPFGADNNL
ncbi:hypothetical protein F4813DRAFT_395776 [Daldinia decipiens]|uniref:uncharacterized protein n=1 Tax=Daldinia decipiens TaxID=326647 RepID=UPI0020C27619|nr:uncharacterized protein F4813DRAFT_395776 [Daldinia decipiens]KAI1658482.1 hypothetical protein F4813DRAFT_395776 [Daldinia decipiens]